MRVCVHFNMLSSALFTCDGIPRCCFWLRLRNFVLHEMLPTNQSRSPSELFVGRHVIHKSISSSYWATSSWKNYTIYLSKSSSVTVEEVLTESDRGLTVSARQSTRWWISSSLKLFQMSPTEEVSMDCVCDRCGSNHCSSIQVYSTTWSWERLVFDV